MKQLIAGTVLALFGTLAATATLAQDGPPPPPPLSRAQAQTQATERFAAMDANGDGTVSEAEAEAAAKAMRDRFGGGRRGDGSPPPPPLGEGAHRGPGGPGGPRGGMGMMGPRWFEQADADGNGKVTAAEANAAALARFDRMDSNHDGTLTPDEMRPGRGPGGDGPPPREN